MIQAIVADTETTDLINNSGLPIEKMPHTIEFCGIKLKLVDGEWEQVDILDFLAKPPFPISAEVQKITGIDDEMVQHSAPFGERFEEVQNFFSGVDIMVAHNLSYDKHVLQNEARRINRMFLIPPREVCTVEVAEPLFGRRMNLNDLHEALFGIRFEAAHRARNDVEATVRVFKKFWEDGEI